MLPPSELELHDSNWVFSTKISAKSNIKWIAPPWLDKLEQEVNDEEPLIVI
jgi:protein-tyrosine phosphatase